MSWRYGRKQKRAHREMIADLACVNFNLQKRLDSAREEYRSERQKLNRLGDVIRDWDSEIRSLLGPYTSFSINDTTYRVDHPDQIRQMAVMPPLPRIIDFSSEIMVESVAYHLSTILGFMVDLSEKDLMTLRQHLTLRVMIGSERLDSSYYAFSESMWHALKNDSPEGRERIASRVARDLVETLARGAEKKRA